MNYSFEVSFIDRRNGCALYVDLDYFSVGFPCLQKVVDRAFRKARKIWGCKRSVLSFYYIELVNK